MFVPERKKNQFHVIFPLFFQGAVHFKIVKYERIKFLVIALRESIEIYAWAPKPYHKFMAFKVSFFTISREFTKFHEYFRFLQSFSELQHKPLLVDLTVEEGTRLKVLYGSAQGFHAVDLDSASVYDIYTPKHAQGPIVPHTIGEYSDPVHSPQSTVPSPKSPVHSPHSKYPSP